VIAASTSVPQSTEIERETNRSKSSTSKTSICIHFHYGRYIKIVNRFNPDHLIGFSDREYILMKDT
jgi:hypothetical protein